MDHPPELLTRIGRFLEQESRDRFEDLALEVFAFQWHRIPPYRRLCEARGVAPGLVASWKEVPAVPTAAYKTLHLAAAPAQEIFRTSGTTPGQRGTHYHPFPELYRRTIDASFPTYCLAGQAELPILSLIPSREQLADSSLSFMADHLLERFGAKDNDGRENEVAFGPRGTRTREAGLWCERRRRDGRPGLILATAFSLLQWLDELAETETTRHLPPGTVLFETGGFKGKSREISRRELLRQVELRLGITTEMIVREYGMTELTSQLYSRGLLGGDPELLVAPHWVRVRILDPLTLEEAPRGSAGIISIFDLANLGSAANLLTQDLGILEKGGLRLLGRASGAELRGCSLSAEELSSATR